MKRFLIGWGYLSEILLTIGLYTLANILIGPVGIAAFMEFAWVPLATFVGVIIAGNLGFVWLYHQQNDPEFSQYLHYKGAHPVYLYALLFSLSVSFACGAALLIAGYLKTTLGFNIAAIAVLYSGIGLYTCVANAAGLMALRNEFRAQWNRIIDS